jgi:divalent metal cation (Fe/Co/Zn/Cd) transporter
MSDKKAGLKRWHLKSRVVLMVLGLIAIIVYLLQAGLAKQYAGVGAALCVISVGGFLIWHAIHVFLEEDVIEEQQINKDKATASSPQQNPADKETNS